MVSRARQVEIEVEIVEMLKDYGLASYPMSIGKVAEALGIALVPYSSLRKEKRELALAASGDAFGIHNADFTVAKIAFNDMEGSYFNRSRFSGGHEVGHIHLEHTEDTPNREAEADYYAGYLLAPHPLVLTMPREASVADKFGISQMCADFAYDQAQNRRREGDPWKPHEKWLIENATWKGGGLIGRP